VPGNLTATAGFNGWFDPEAAQTALRLPIRQKVIPLDVTNTVFATSHVPACVRIAALPRGGLAFASCRMQAAQQLAHA